MYIDSFYPNIRNSNFKKYLIMDKLISMTDFVLYKDENGVKINRIEQIQNYANFLKQPLTLAMFVPATLIDGIWVVLYDPKLPHLGSENQDSYMEHYNKKRKEYQKAKYCVLFEGFEAIKWDHGGDSYSVRKNHGTDNEVQVCYYKAIPDYFVWSFDTVEQLTTKNLELTESAKQQLL